MELANAVENAVKKCKKQRVDAYEVLGLNERSLVIEAKQSAVDSFRRNEMRGIAIRLVRKGRMGWAATTDISMASVGRAVEQAALAMQEVAVSEEAIIPPVQSSCGAIEEAPGRSYDSISDEEKMGLAVALEAAAVSADPRVRCVRRPRYEEFVRRMVVSNSHGAEAQAERGMVSGDLRVVVSQDDLSESAYDFDFSTRFEALDMDAIGKRAAQRAVEKLGAQSFDGGNLPVLFDARAAATLVRLIAPSFFATNVQRGKSVIAGRLGERVYSPAVTLIDDGLLPDGFGTFPFDAEGIPKRRTTMIADGTVEHWLYDGARAARDGVASTGNCVRETLSALPVIDVGNCFLAPGPKGVDALIADVERGVWVTELLGAHTANVITGDFSFGVEGALIEGGQRGAPMRGMTIAGNIHDLFSRIRAVADDTRFMGVYGSPSLLVEGLTLGA